MPEFIEATYQTSLKEFGFTQRRVKGTVTPLIPAKAAPAVAAADAHADADMEGDPFRPQLILGARRFVLNQRLRRWQQFLDGTFGVSAQVTDAHALTGLSRPGRWQVVIGAFEGAMYRCPLPLAYPTGPGLTLGLCYFNVNFNTNGVKFKLRKNGGEVARFEYRDVHPQHAHLFPEACTFLRLLKTWVDSHGGLEELIDMTGADEDVIDLTSDHEYCSFRALMW